MSCYHLNSGETSINVPSFEVIDNVAFYMIHIKCWGFGQEKEWTVSHATYKIFTNDSLDYIFPQVCHRYRDFEKLHEKLQKETALAKDLLPGKKIIKNREFLETRQRDLEKYLQTVAKTVQHQVPLDFVEFLDFHKFDVNFLLQKLAMELSQRNSSDHKLWTFTILEVN